MRRVALSRPPGVAMEQPWADMPDPDVGLGGEPSDPMQPAPLPPATGARRAITVSCDALEYVAKAFLVVAVFAQLLLVIIAVFGRYFASWSPPALEETAGYLFIWIVMLGLPVAMRRSGLEAIELIPKRFPRTEKPLRLLSGLMILAFFGFALESGWRLIASSTDILSAGSGIPIGYAYAGIFVTGVLGIVFALEALVAQFVWERQTLIGFLLFVACVAGYIALKYYVPLTQGEIILVALLVLAACLVVAVPISISLGLSAFVAVSVSGSVPLQIVAQRMADGLNNFVLLAVPFFLLAGTVMARTTLASRLLNLAKSLVGRCRGGLASSDIVASVVFADMSGSAIADTAALGTIVIPELRRAGYSGSRAAALQASAGALGIMFPPSITMIIYASVANVSVVQAFLSLIIPGVCLTVCYLVLAYIRARRANIDRGEKLSPRQRVRLGAPGIPVMLVPAIILGGIFSGAATPAESGSLAVLATLLLAILGFRELKPRAIINICVESSMTVARVGLIIASATALGWIVTVFNGPQAMLDFLVNYFHRPAVVLLLIGAALVLIHMVMDAAATMLVVTPLLLPVFMQMHISLLHFGVLLNVTSAAGLLIPPLGFNVLIASRIAGVSVGETTKAAAPYFLITLALAVLVVFVPALSMFLPNHL